MLVHDGPMLACLGTVVATVVRETCHNFIGIVLHVSSRPFSWDDNVGCDAAKLGRDPFGTWWRLAYGLQQLQLQAS